MLGLLNFSSCRFLVIWLLSRNTASMEAHLAFTRVSAPVFVIRLYAE